MLENYGEELASSICKTWRGCDEQKIDFGRHSPTLADKARYLHVFQAFDLPYSQDQRRQPQNSLDLSVLKCRCDFVQKR